MARETGYSETAEWLCRETGLSKSKYTKAAINHMLTSSVSILRQQKRSSCSGSQSLSQHGSIHAISELCVPIITSEEAVPLVECLLNVAFHSTDLSPLFLEAVTKNQRECSDVGNKVSLSYSAKLSLWTHYLPSYRQQLLDMMEECSSLGESSSRDAIDVILTKYQIPEACLDRPQLSLYTKEFILSINYFESIQIGMSALESLVRVLNTSIMELYLSKTIRPSACPQFSMQQM